MFDSSTLIIIFLSFSAAFAQGTWDVSEGSFKDRIILGGSFGLQFGDVTFVDISPRLGYRATNKLTVGVGAIYRYRKQESFRTSQGVFPELKTNDWGFNVFGRHMLYGPLYVHAEYEYLNFEAFTGQIIGLEAVTERFDLNSILLGGGIAQPIGNKAVFVAEALYIVNYDSGELTPYANPWVVRVGIGVGL